MIPSLQHSAADSVWRKFASAHDYELARSRALLAACRPSGARIHLPAMNTLDTTAKFSGPANPAVEEQTQRSIAQLLVNMTLCVAERRFAHGT